MYTEIEKLTEVRLCMFSTVYKVVYICGINELVGKVMIEAVPLGPVS